jgi:hypothetical protein
MPERHTVDFDRLGVNVLSDAERGTVVLQFDRASGDAKTLAGVVKGVNGRFGGGAWRRWNRWVRGERDVLKIVSPAVPHPENPDVIRVEMAASPGVPMDVALGVLLDFFRRQPGYRRTFGAPLDRDGIDARVCNAPGDLSGVALDVLRRLLEHRNKQIPGGQS